MVGGSFVRVHVHSGRSTTSPLSEPALRIGDKVEALYRGRGNKWYPGAVTGKNVDGTYRVTYDDGDKEDSIARQHIRSLAPSSIGRGSELSGRRPTSPLSGQVTVVDSHADASASRALRVGDKVEGLYRGRGTKWFKGEIPARNSHGPYRVL